MQVEVKTSADASVAVTEDTTLTKRKVGFILCIFLMTSVPSRKKNVYLLLAITVSILKTAGKDMTLHRCFHGHDVLFLYKHEDLSARQWSIFGVVPSAFESGISILNLEP